MGTSTARRGPSTAAWRWAKGSATRYLSPEGATAVEAREVVRRYVAALQETGAAQGQDLLAEFRLTRKAAQSLGEFGQQVAESGLAAALEARGLADLAQAPPEAAVSGLTSAWVEEQGGLESQVARTALAKCLIKVFSLEPGRESRLEGSDLVRAFLANALYHRLVLDLGESLEAAAPGWSDYHQGLARLEEELQGAVVPLPEDPLGSDQWQGLAGWVWVTEVLEKILKAFQDQQAL
jgi:hypothetical protein